MTSFETTNTEETSASPSTVLDTIRNAHTWSSWQPEIEHAEGPERLAPGDAVLGRANMLGFVVHGRSTIEATDDLSLDEDVIVGVRMKIRFEVAAGTNGTVVSHRLTSEMPGGPLGRVLTFFLKRRLVKMQATALERLTQVAEGSA